MRVAVIACALALSGSPFARGASAEAMEHFSAASAAFQAEDYSRARALFEQALAAGLEGPAIHYNIASAAYLGGDLPRAEREFREVARTPAMAALAYYNLGLVALQRRDEREARDWFERTLHEPGTDARLDELASRLLVQLAEPRAANAWYYYTRAGIGHDDNVALRSASVEGAATGTADEYGELIFASSYSIGNWRLDTGGSMFKYASLDDFDQNSYFLGGARGFRHDNWYFELGAYGSQSSLGGDVYERDVAVGAQATRLFYGGSRLRAQLRGSSVKGHGEFSGLTGQRTELGLSYDKRWRAWNFGAHTRAELEDSEDPVFETQWLQLGADLGYAFSPLWGVTASAALRRTRHAAQGEALKAWDDERASLLVGITRTLWRQAQLFLRYELERNASPVAGYDYDRNRVSASIEIWR
jgi:tetratricopeptide (TPR) repeat protein